MSPSTYHVDAITFSISSDGSSVNFSKNYRMANYNGGQSWLCDYAYGTYSLSSFSGQVSYTKAVPWAGGTAVGHLNADLYGISGGAQGYYSQVTSTFSGLYVN